MLNGFAVVMSGRVLHLEDGVDAALIDGALRVARVPQREAHQQAQRLASAHK